MPHISGSTTVCTKAAAMAASTALPPARIASMPASAASGCGATTMPLSNTGSLIDSSSSGPIRRQRYVVPRASPVPRERERWLEILLEHEALGDQRLRRSLNARDVDFGRAVAIEDRRAQIAGHRGLLSGVGQRDGRAIEAVHRAIAEPARADVPAGVGRE